MTNEQFNQPGVAPAPKRSDAPAGAPACCGTGCTVCVLDYPELFLDQAAHQDRETLAMLEAFERAQAAQVSAEQDAP